MEGTGNDKSLTTEYNNTRKHLPLGNPITPELSPVLGDVFQSWNFLSCFHEVLGLGKCLSLEELTTELTGRLFGGLCEAQMSMLRIVLDEMPVTSKWGKNDVPILNVRTWPELARRYFLFGNGGLYSSHVHDGNSAQRCLYGDGGPALGKVTGLDGLKLDTWLLAEATQKVYGCLNREEDMVFIQDIDSESGSVCLTILEVEEIPDWVKILEPIKKLQTNVGSRIRKCIQDSIDNDPPKWAKDELERSISKEVYISNASGVTKNAALNVVAHFKKMQKLMWSSKNGRNLLTLSDIVLRKCRILLRQSVNTFASHIGGKVLLDFRTIDMKLGTGAYCGSHQAFAEDFQEVLSSLSPILSNLTGNFEQEYNKEVIGFRQKLLSYSKVDSLTPDLMKEMQVVLASTLEIPKALWDEVLCEVCGMNKDDDKVLLCDGCDAGYHTYCLKPALARVPKGNWFCLSCIANNDATQVATLRATLPALKQKTEKREHLMNLVDKETSDLAIMLQDQEYWELTALEKTRLLKFFCDELLNSKTLNRHMEKLNSRSLRKRPVGYEFLGLDSMGRLYWKLDAGSSHCIIVNERGKTHQDDSQTYGSVHNCFEKGSGSSNTDDLCVLNDSEHEFPALCQKLYTNETLEYTSWVCYHGEVERKRILDFIKDEESMGEKLSKLTLQSGKLEPETNTISKMQDLNELKCSTVELPMCLLVSNCSGTKATESLHSKYGSFTDFDMNIISGQQNDIGKVAAQDYMYRCECLEPITPGALHCFWCHETIVNKELRLHGDARCNTSLTTSYHNDEICQTTKGEGTSGVSLEEFQKGDSTFILQKIDPELDVGKLFKVPSSSQKSLSGNSYDVLKHLKICLLDMEAALPREAVRLSTACTNRKRAWQAFVKKVDTIYEMVQAMIVLEDMIKPDYLDRSWQKWSSISAAANISTLAALSLRIYSLDAALCYEGSPCASDPLKLQSTADKKNRKQGSTANKRRKLTETNEQVS